MCNDFGQNRVGTNYHSFSYLERGFVVSLVVMQKYLVALGVMVVLFIVPMTVGAADLVPECGGDGQPACQACYVVELVNNVVGWLVMILGVIAAILIVVAGSRLVTSGGNASAKEQAKSSMTNLIIGYIIVLSAWLVMDYGLRALLVEGGDAQFGIWNAINCVDQPVSNTEEVVQEEVAYIPLDGSLGSLPGWVSAASTPGGGGVGAGPGGGTVAPGTLNAACTRLPGPPPQAVDCSAQQAQCTAAGGRPTLNSAGTIVTCTPRPVVVDGGTGGSLPQCTNSACSVAALMAVGMTSQQANIMSCIAMTESSGNPNARTTVPGSSACGTFQITRTTWNTYNNIAACSNHEANCRNASCNMRVATILVRTNGYRDWTCPGCNPNAIRCINRYGG